MNSEALITRGVLVPLVAATVACVSTGSRPPRGLPDERAETVASVAYSSDAAAQHSTPSANAYAPGADGTRRKVMASGALMLESSSLDLSMALASHAREPTADSELALAQAYLRHGVLDKASEHFASASRINPREGLAWDGLARVWRAWGFPQFGLGDAYRAVSASPDSPAARNTLGTILQDLGEGAAARAQFERASALDPLAAYPLNNLCYSWLAEANVEAGLPACQRALRLDPTLAVARGNLALATAIAAQRTYKHPQP